MSDRQKYMGKRATRTVSSLSKVLLNLIEHHGIDNISVSQLCREAGVHRTTFYGHYESVDAFVIEALTDIVDKMAAVDVRNSDKIEDIIQSYDKTLCNMLILLKDKRQTYRTLFNSSIGSSFREALFSTMSKRLWLAMDVLCQRQVKVNVPDDLAVKFIAGALTSSLEDWVMSNAEDIQLRSQEIFSLFPSWWPKETKDL